MVKRWALNTLALALGLSVGSWAVHYASARVTLPPLAAWLLWLFFAALFYGIAQAAGPKLLGSGEAAPLSFRPELPRRPWAWLKPAGVALRSPFPLNKDQVFIGREIRCDVMINNDSVSRRHAEIIRQVEGWVVRDLDSRNGTFLNGQRIQEALLQEGDLLSVGDIHLTFEGPRQPVRGGDQETVSHLVLQPQQEGEETAVHPPKDGAETEVWRPKS